MIDEEFRMEEYTDFMIKLYRGAVIPIGNPNFYNHRVEIEIYSSKLEEIEGYTVRIEGKDYKIKSQNLLNKIKNFVNENLETLINWSLHQNKSNLDENAYEGGMGRSIKIKCGQLTIFVNGQVIDIGELCDKFINEIVTLIIDEGDKTDADYITEGIMNATEEIISVDLTEEEQEFEKYCNIYEERFGKRAYIAEPSGTMQQTINAIKKCLEEDKDMLDDLLYPNFEDDMKNRILY